MRHAGQVLAMVLVAALPSQCVNSLPRFVDNEGPSVLNGLRPSSPVAGGGEGGEWKGGNVQGNTEKTCFTLSPAQHLLQRSARSAAVCPQLPQKRALCVLQGREDWGEPDDEWAKLTRGQGMPPVMSNKGEKEEGGGKKETEDSEKKSEVEILKARLEAAEGRVRAEQEQAIKRREERRKKKLADLAAAGVPVPRKKKQLRLPSPADVLAQRGSAGDELWSKLPASMRENYKFRRLLGRGSFGSVFLAEDRRGTQGLLWEDTLWPSRQAAIKIVKPRNGEEPIVMREGLVLSLLDSPFVPACYDYGLYQGYFYIAMEYFEGPTLDQMLVNGPFTARQAAQVGLEVLEALQVIHNAGFVYRDVKPQNIIQSNVGQVKSHRLVDFGSATGLSGCVWGGVASAEEGCLLSNYGEDTLKKLKAVFKSVASPVDSELDQDASYSQKNSALPPYMLPKKASDGTAALRSSELRIRPSDLAKCFSAVGVKPKHKELVQLVAKYDADRTGVISVEEFYEMFAELVQSQDDAFPAGTYAYMAPEQLLPHNHSDITVAVDIYSLGVTLYKLVTRRLPVQPVRDLTWRPGAKGAAGQDERSLWQRVVADLDKQPPALSDINPSLPTEFCQIVARAMQRRPERSLAQLSTYAISLR